MSDLEEPLVDVHRQHRIPPAELVGKLQKKYTDKHGVERFIELDYLGHAAVTDILLTVDPRWIWEPIGYDDTGRPLLDRDKDGWPRGMWIQLTVHGHTRLGYGTCRPGKEDAIKELIGDALRNAAMRFGIGLSLWAKEEWAEEDVQRKEVGGTTGGSQAGSGAADEGKGSATAENGPGRGNVRRLPKPSQEDIARHPAGGPILLPDQAIAARAAELGLSDAERKDVIRRVTDGRTDSGKELRGTEGSLVFAELEALAKAKSRGPA